MSTIQKVTTAHVRVKVGDRIRPVPGDGRTWWLVEARSDRYIIATQQRPFHPKGERQYTVIDTTGWTHAYNGVNPGVVRSSVNSIGGGHDVDPEGIRRMLAELESGDLKISHRRVMAVSSIETRGDDESETA